MPDQPTPQPQQQPQPRETVDPGAVVKVLQETHPDIVMAAYWRVRAERAEAELLAPAEQSA